MSRFFTHSLLIACLLVLSNNPAKANDSDVVNCGKPYKIVVIGSSTAYGTGASPVDSSWVNKLTYYVKRKNSKTAVYNLGVPGVTTYEILCPDGFANPANRPAPKTGYNISEALRLQPDAIIINLPSNDAFYNYTVQEQQANYERTMVLANAANIPVWVTTTQPRNNLTSAQITNLTQVKDWTYTRFGSKAVDFWTTLANGDGTINTIYNFDGTHLNNAGHTILYQRIIAEAILDTLCNRSGNLVARAGTDTSLVLPTNSVILNGSASTGTNTITSYAWTKISGPANGQITNAADAIATATNLSEGRYAYELKVTDNTGATNRDTVNVVVSSRILIDFGPTLTTLDANGKYWNNVINTQNGVQLQNAITTTNTITGISLEVVNRIDGTFDVGGPGTNTGNTAGDVGDYPNSATTDFAFAEPSATNGMWTFSGLNSLKQYTFKFWGTRSVTDNRTIEIKRADETTWKEYNASGNTDYLNAAIFSFSGKTEMSFNIRVKTGSVFGYINIVDITATTVPDIANLPPAARAGDDIKLTVPTSSTTLNGNGSSDEDGTITGYQWTKIAGPAAYSIASPNSAITLLNNLTQGIYAFELQVTDNNGAVSKDTVSVTVSTRILIDFGPTLTTTDANGKYWNNVTNTQSGVQLQNAITTGNAATTIGLTVVNRIDGTFDVGGPGTNTGNTIGDVGDYPNSATTDFAFAEPSTTSGSWKITGLDAQKQYSIKFWGARSVDDNRTLQIKRNDEIVWQEYNTAMNSDYNNAAYFTFSGKTEQSFDIRVKTGSVFGYINVIDINVTTPNTNCIPVTPLVTITVNPALPTCSGKPLTFTAVATNGGTTPIYQWTKNGVAITGANGNTYTSTTLANNDVINCILSSNIACATTPTATSNNITVGIKNLTSSVATVSACNTYTWNGVAYTTSGTYIKTGLINKAGCDSTATLILTVVKVKTVPDAITGPSNACPYSVSATNPNGVIATYKINKVANALSYIWTVPTNATITSRPGGSGTANDTIITVKYANNFTSGYVSVAAVNVCGVSTSRTLYISETVPAVPAAISGATNVCNNIATATAATYKISKVEGAIDYDWIISGSGATIIGHPAGEGVNDTIVTVLFTGAFSSGTLSVRSIGNCGSNGIARTLSLQKTAPDAPVVTGSTSVCGGGTAIYKANGSLATSYTWTVPLGASIIGANNGASVTVKFPGLFLLGSVTARAITPCGTTSSSSLLVYSCILGGFSKNATTIESEALTLDSRNTTQEKTVIVEENIPPAINIFPNPSDGNFKISVNGNKNASAVIFEVFNNYGQSLYKISSADKIVNLSIAHKLKNGMYYVRCTIRGKVLTQKLIIQK